MSSLSLVVRPFLNSIGRKGHISTFRMYSNAPKILFTDIGLTSDGSVALTMGAPAERHLKKVSDILNEAGQHAKDSTWNADASYLQYGPKQGSPRYRANLAQFLSQGYGDNVKSDNLVVTAGGTHGLHLVGSVMFPNNGTVFVEDPTYFIAINMLRTELGMEIQAVPTDDKGMVPAELDRQLSIYCGQKEPDEKHPFCAMIYLVPTYNNPRGYCIPEDRCRELISVARKHEALLFCDDVYNLLHFGAEKHAPPRLLSYDSPEDPNYKGNTLSNGTFSKIMAPGLRLGWIECGERITNLLTNNNVMWSAGSANHFTSEVVASALELGLEQAYLRQLNQEYKENVQALCETLKSGLPEEVRFNCPEGGYFIWIEMPQQAKSVDVANMLYSEYKIKVLQGQMCSATGKYSNCIRISFSHYPKEILLDAAQKLCSVISKHLSSL